MMTQLRERTALVLWFVIFAFIGLIVVEWGADYSGTATTDAGDAVGVVNGEKISIKEFQTALRNASRQQSREQRDDQGRLVREVWDAYVSEILLNQEIERLGIQVTDKEIALYTRTQPPPAVQGLEAFQTEGKFDMAKYNQFLSDRNNLRDPNNKAFVMQVESMIGQQLLNFKLQRILMETVQVSPPEVQNYFREQNEKVRVEYVFAPAANVSDDAAQVTDADLAAYYEKHRSDFEHPAQIRFQYVYFPKTASAQDSARVVEEIGQLRREIVEDGSDFAELASVVSDDPVSAANGGDLGTFGRGRMVEAFEKAAFSLDPGQVSQPIETRFGWHLIKVEEKVQEEGEEKVHARHILLRYKPSRGTVDDLRSRAEEFQQQAETAGFDAALQTSGLTAQDSGYLQEGQPVPGMGEDTSWLVNTFFESEMGAVSRVIENDQGLWVARLAEKREKGVAPLEQVRVSVERTVLLEKKAEVAAARLQKIRQQVLSGTPLEKAAEAEGLEVRSPEPFARDASVTGIGRRNVVIGEAFRLGPGELSEAITMSRGAYLLRVVEKQTADEGKFAEEREKTRQQLLAMRQEEALQNWFAHVYDVAQIEDYRHRYFTF